MLANAFSPMNSILFPSIAFDSLLFENASLPIVITPSPNSISCNMLPINACSLIVSTVPGIEQLFIAAFLKARIPILTRESGKLKLVIPVFINASSPIEYRFTASSVPTIVVSNVSFLKAVWLIVCRSLSTPSTIVRDEQFSNAPESMPSICSKAISVTPV